MKNPNPTHLEDRTARLTILIDPRKKALFERLCSQEDLTSSQVVRRMIRAYIEQRLGRPWSPGDADAEIGGGNAARSGAKRRMSSRA
jgi:hypothetical protein